MFLISQVGTEEGAENFLDRLEEDRAVRGILFRTAGGLLIFSFLFFLLRGYCVAALTYKNSEHLDEKYEELRQNEQNLEQWVRKYHCIYFE